MTMLSMKGIRQPHTRNWSPEMRPRRNEAAVGVGARPFHGQQHRPAPFTADTYALDEANDCQDDGAPDADRLVGRNEADGEGREPGQEQGRDQRSLAADAVAIVAEDHRSD